MPAKKMLPDFATDEEAEHFVETADLTEYDLSSFINAPLAWASEEPAGPPEPNRASA